jgi:hypothetical protein
MLVLDQATKGHREAESYRDISKRVLLCLLKITGGSLVMSFLGRRLPLLERLSAYYANS